MLRHAVSDKQQGIDQLSQCVEDLDIWGHLVGQ